MGSARQFIWQQENVIKHTQRLLYSFQHWTGKPLLNLGGTPDELAQALFMAPFALVSHGVEDDPVFNYGNHVALELWQLDWDRFTRMPSRYSAEPIEQAERQRLLATTQSKGVCDYRGVRVSSIGQRFLVEDGIIWNVIDRQHCNYGQSATFTKWKQLN